VAAIKIARERGRGSGGTPFGT